jgi:hypothetical protein
MKAYRASILRFDAQQQAVFDKDGLLVVGFTDGDRCERVLAVGAHGVGQSCRSTISRELPISFTIISG